jgi:NADPH2:quinone reductase
MMVSYGQSSGVVPPFDITTLSAKGSLYLTRPSLAHYTATPEALRSSASELFRILSEGVKIEIGQTYPLKEAAKAHVELEGRKTVGSSLLLP